VSAEIRPPNLLACSPAPDGDRPTGIKQLTKAEAGAEQCLVRSESRFEEPFFWAPFVVRRLVMGRTAFTLSFPMVLRLSLVMVTLATLPAAMALRAGLGARRDSTVALAPPIPARPELTTKFQTE
jgi:hypothetical protein